MLPALLAHPLQLLNRLELRLARPATIVVVTYGAAGAALGAAVAAARYVAAVSPRRPSEAVRTRESAWRANGVPCDRVRIAR